MDEKLFNFYHEAKNVFHKHFQEAVQKTTELTVLKDVDLNNPIIDQVFNVAHAKGVEEGWEAAINTLMTVFGDFVLANQELIED